MNLFCNKHGITDFNIRTSGKRICKKCEMIGAKKYRSKIKEKAILYKGGSCIKCGYNKCFRSLDFHHRDPLQKDFSIGESRGGKKIVRNWEKLTPELDKCDLLCRNCHGEVHAELSLLVFYETFDYKIHRKDINFINDALLKGRKTPEIIISEISEGKYTHENYNARELRHQEWLINNNVLDKYDDVSS